MLHFRSTISNMWRMAKHQWPGQIKKKKSASRFEINKWSIVLFEWTVPPSFYCITIFVCLFIWSVFRIFVIWRGIVSHHRCSIKATTAWRRFAIHLLQRAAVSYDPQHNFGLSQSHALIRVTNDLFLSSHRGCILVLDLTPLTTTFF